MSDFGGGGGSGGGGGGGGGHSPRRAGGGGDDTNDREAQLKRAVRNPARRLFTVPWCGIEEASKASVTIAWEPV